MTFDALDDVCRRYLGEPLQEVSHIRLLSRKADADLGPLEGQRLSLRRSVGTYRLMLQTKRGRQWSLIYKSDIRPADLSEFKECWFYGNVQQALGCSTEYLVYGTGDGEKALAQYLPSVYRCSEISPGRHYQYLVEDLIQYRRVSDPSAVLTAAKELPSIHRALNEVVSMARPKRLFHADSLHQYIAEHLEGFARRTAEPVVAEVCNLWSRACGMFSTREAQDLGAVHGDFRLPDNILIHRSRPDQIKIVDWESVAWDVPYQDLCYLLEGVKATVEEQALAAYSEGDERLSLEDHRRWYQWCRLRRIVRDIAWYARQHMQGFFGGSLLDRGRR